MRSGETSEDQQRSTTAVPFDFGSADNGSGGHKKPRKSFLRRLWGWFKWCLFLLLAPLFVYLVIALVGAAWPVNSDFEPASDGVEIFILSGDVHTDLILPITTQQQDWREKFPADSFPTNRTDFTHVSIGWGARQFYLETPTWSDLKVSTVANVLFTPSESVMHVQMIRFEPVISSSVMSTRISPEQYQQLIEFIEASFADDSAQPAAIADAAYSDNDHFYPAIGDYHLFRTCNCWAGAAMQAAGIKVGKFTPLPKTIFWHLDQ